MDINTRLDGFIIHPLDAFNDKHHEDNLLKFSNTAPNLDGFKVHPLDSFIIHEHDNNYESNINDNFTINYAQFNQNNSLDVLSDDRNYNAGNISSEYNLTNNSELYQTSNQDIMSTPSFNNYINIEQTYSGNNTDISYNQYPVSGSNMNYIESASPNLYTLDSTPTTTSTTNYFNDTYSSYYPSTSNYENIMPTIYKNELTQNTTGYINSNNAISNISYAAPSVVTPSQNEISIVPMPKLRRVNTIPASKISSINLGNFKKSGFAFKHFPSTLGYSKSNYSLPQNRSYASLYKVNPYNVTTFEPDIKNNTIQKTRVIIPVKKRVVIPRKTTVIVPKKVLIPKPVLIQPVPTIQVAMPQTVPLVVPNSSTVQTVPGNVLMPTIPVAGPQNSIRLVQNNVEKFPMDNMRRVVKTSIMAAPKMNSKIYVPRRFDKKY